MQLVIATSPGGDIPYTFSIHTDREFITYYLTGIDHVVPSDIDIVWVLVIITGTEITHVHYNDPIIDKIITAPDDTTRNSICHALNIETATGQDYIPEVINYKQIAQYLFKILDDIDTFGDVAKDDDKLYRVLVENAHRRRFEVAVYLVMI